MLTTLVLEETDYVEYLNIWDSLPALVNQLLPTTASAAKPREMTVDSHLMMNRDFKYTSCLLSLCFRFWY